MASTTKVRFLFGLFFTHEGYWQHILPKRRLIFKGLQGVIFQNMEHFISTAVGTSNPAGFRRNVISKQKQNEQRMIKEEVPGRFSRLFPFATLAFDTGIEKV